jgi:hypothetical protein
VTTGVVVACPCGEVYELKPEYAGRLVECPVCGRHLRAGSGGGAPRRSTELDPAFDRDVFLLRERLLTVRAAYEVWAEDGTPILYVERPTFPVRTLLAYVVALVAASVVVAVASQLADVAGPPMDALVMLAGYLLSIGLFVIVSMSARPLRHVTVYRDERRREVLLRITQDQRLAFLTRTYTVLTPAGVTLARLCKRYVHNVLRKRWYVQTVSGDRVAMAIEDSVVLSLLRRVLGSLFGVLRTNFVLVHLGRTQDGSVFGEFNRKFTLFDRYVLDLSADPERRFDRRVAVALGVMLDTGERR